MNSEKVAISVQKSALRKQIEALEEREREIHLHEEDAHHINSNELPALKDGVNPSAVNYVAGQSKGYVDGFRAAINTIVLSLSSEYREIPMTESELYMIIELGEMKERAWLKNRKDEEMLEKQGWKQEREGFVQFWVKKDMRMVKMIVIRTMTEMPKTCEDCPCCDDYYRCGASGKKFEDEDFDIWERRMLDCPLIDLSKYEDDCK